MWSGMVPMRSTSHASPERLAEPDRATLLALARSAIEYGLTHRRPPPVDPKTYSISLQAIRATFVTLTRRGNLRGCIGQLTATRPLVVDVAENAFAAAFRDPRFPPLTAPELSELELHLSILTPSTPLAFSSEADLLSQLQSGVDGLILEETPPGDLARATFLPAVWESLPNPQDFLRHLKRKAGLPADYWSPTLRAFRYRTESFPDGIDEQEKSA
ncbi:AmmeMemoRadiSam system protein A [Gammaproteobacteria bacterium]